MVLRIGDSTTSFMYAIKEGEIYPERGTKKWDGILEEIVAGSTVQERIDLFREFNIIESAKEQVLRSFKGETRVIPRAMKLQLNQCPLSDAGNAEAFIRLYGDRVRYDHREGIWMIYKGGTWREDKSGEIRRLGLKAIRFRQQAASEAPTQEEQQRIYKYTIRSENSANTNNMLRMLKNMAPIAEVGDSWNRHKHLLGTPNGVLNLGTGEVSKEGMAPYGVTLQTAVTYDREADRSNWMRFLNEVFNGDQELIEYLQLALGYSLTGETGEQVLFAAVGGGANGKSTLMNAVSRVLQDYSAWTDMNTFYQGRQGPRHDLARLEHKRLVASSEHTASNVLDEGNLKRLVGQDRIACRHLYQEIFEYMPQFAIWLLLNVLPKTRDVSHAFWRRIQVIPFSRTFRGDEIDPRIANTFEPNGILAWIVEGAIRYYNGERLQETGKMKEAKEVWKKASDHFNTFIDEMVVKDAKSSIRALDLRRAYYDWCGASVTSPLSPNVIGKRMKQSMGIEIAHNSDGAAIYKGVRLIDY